MPDQPAISKHARERMAERGVTEDHIRSALRRQLPGAGAGDFGNITTLGFGEGTRILKVVLSPDRGTIISVMWVRDGQAG